MMQKTININNSILFIVLFASILPYMNLGSYGVPVLYIFTPICAIVLIFVILGRVKIPKVTKSIIVIWLLIIFEVFISTFYGTISEFNRFIFSTDSVQYITRFLFLITFILVFYKEKVKLDVFIKYFLIILNLGMLIGLLQWIPWPGRTFLVELYPFTRVDIQLEQLNREMHAIRVHGIAQHATANGGLATFFFVYGYAIFKYYKRYKFLSISLMLLSVINIFASQARGGMLALFSAIILFYAINVYITKKSFKPTIYFITIISILYLIIKFFYSRGNKFIETMVYRWNVLFESGGGQRIYQIKNALALLETPGDYLWGLSRAFQNYSGLIDHIEVEPVNILVLYGLAGFSLQYFLIIFLCVYFLKNIRKSIQNKAVLSLLVASLIGLISYQVFSIGFFFFREIRVGLFPWILMGVAIGAFESYKLKMEAKNNEV